jgi:BASS family bile acid:Na+ symporter
LHAIRPFLEACARQGARILAISIFIGLGVPPLAGLFRDVVTITVAGLMTLVLLRVDFSQVLAWLRRPLLIAALLAWLLLGCPILAYAAAALLPISPGFAAGLVVLATGCAATSSPAFARLVGLDGEVAFVVSILSTFLVPFTAPPMALGLMNIDLALSLGGLMARLALLVGLPMALSLALRRIIPAPALAREARAIDGMVVLLVAAYGVGVMDGVLALLLAAPLHVLSGVAMAFTGCLGLNLATALAFSAAGPRLSLAAGLLSGNRNMALYLAVLPQETAPDILLFLTLCQFPLFLSPFLLGPVYRRLRRG